MGGTGRLIQTGSSGRRGRVVGEWWREAQVEDREGGE